MTKRELAKVESALSGQIEKMASLYLDLKGIAVKLMKHHAPENVGPIVDKKIGKTLFFRTTGYIGKCAVDSGELTILDDEKPLAVFVYETGCDDKQSASKNIQL